MKTEIRLITPEEASRLIKTRNPRCVGSKQNAAQWHIDEFAKALRHGRFLTTHQGVAINERGELIDGFHRLSAIAQTGIPATMVVSTGVSDETVPIIDRGQRRNASAVLGVDKRIAEIITFIGKLVTGGSRPLEYELREFQRVFGTAAAQVVECCPTAVRGFSSAPVKSAAMLAHMSGSSFALSRYRALVLMRPEDDPSVSVMMRSLLDDKDQWMRMARAWIGFTRETMPTKIIIKRKDQQVSEIRDVAKEIMIRNKQ